MIRLGLTGSIGMGKSTTAEMFRNAGIPVFDADAAVHQLYAGEAAGLIEAAFPGVVVNGVVDRTLLSSHVIGKPDAMKRLEAIVHPLVREKEKAFVQSAQQNRNPLIVLDIPLLFETGGETRADIIAVVSAPPSVQRKRVLARPGMTVERLEAILAKQMPDAEKRRKAHFVVDTGQGLEQAERQVRDIIRALSGVTVPNRLET
jgi:dephospho-CoA kinase